MIPLLAQLGQAAEPTATVVVAQAGMGTYEFVLALVDKEAVLLLAGGLAAVMGAGAILIRYYAQKLLASVGQVEKQLNGRMQEMIEASAGRARAEGELEGIKKAPPVAPVVVVPPVVPPRDPTTRSRATDAPAERPDDARGPGPPAA